MYIEVLISYILYIIMNKPGKARVVENTRPLATSVLVHHQESPIKRSSSSSSSSRLELEVEVSIRVVNSQ